MSNLSEHIRPRQILHLVQKKSITALMSTNQYILTNNVFNEWELLHDDGRIECAFTRGLRRFAASSTSQLPDTQLRSHIPRRVRKRIDREIKQTEQTIKKWHRTTTIRSNSAQRMNKPDWILRNCKNQWKTTKRNFKNRTQQFVCSSLSILQSSFVSVSSPGSSNCPANFLPSLLSLSVSFRNSHKSVSVAHWALSANIWSSPSPKYDETDQMRPFPPYTACNCFPRNLAGMSTLQILLPNPPTRSPPSSRSNWHNKPLNKMPCGPRLIHHRLPQNFIP